MQCCVSGSGQIGIILTDPNSNLYPFLLFQYAVQNIDNNGTYGADEKD
jgi:hypothetical protein